jgi:hypothetical protein
MIGVSQVEFGGIKFKKFHATSPDGDCSAILAHTDKIVLTLWGVEYCRIRASLDEDDDE